MQVDPVYQRRVIWESPLSAKGGVWYLSEPEKLGGSRYTKVGRTIIATAAAETPGPQHDS